MARLNIRVRSTVWGSLHDGDMTFDLEPCASAEDAKIEIAARTGFSPDHMILHAAGQAPPMEDDALLRKHARSEHGEIVLYMTRELHVAALPQPWSGERE
jgi:hypothetical protein